ncbi:hypothetical protein WA026_009716 [Henosepilachna vigintioctopunctata]|uniref:Rab proteins geranylgeranyltransferase component A n=1 Tax=Henosepilachna vigintioctopunctata TaxID=420089 RepID=A0AAW1TSM2_9CUCU
MDYDLPTEFDLIVVGTGLIESIISAAASRIGKQVLHVDVNNYYGGHWASFNLEDFLKLKQADSKSVDIALEGDSNDKDHFLPIGNSLNQLQHFEIDWNVPDRDNKSDSLIEKNETHDEVEEIKVNKDCQQDVLGVTKEENVEVGPQLGEKELKEKCDTEEIQPVKDEIEQKCDEITQESLRKDSRKFVIDLCPKLQFARGDFVELLISSNIARYAEFRSISRVLTWINGNLEVVPCSRSDVFANNKVSVIEKRMLMKLLTSIEEDEKNPSVTEGTTFKDFLKSKKLSENILHFVLYALSMSTNETLWLEGIKKTKRFLNSLGRFGKTPFLFSMYGSGEITQAFCRLSAVFGGVFALNQKLHGLVLKNNKFESLLCGKQKILSPHIVMNVGLAPESFLKYDKTKLLSRASLITNKSLVNSEKEHMTLLLYPAANNKLCTVLELGSLTGTCPKNLFLVHITTKGSDDPKEDLRECIESLFPVEAGSETSEKPKILWSSYFSIPDTNELNLNSFVPSNVFLCPGPDSDLDYDLSLKKVRIHIFESIPQM